MEKDIGLKICWGRSVSFCGHTRKYYKRFAFYESAEKCLEDFEKRKRERERGGRGAWIGGVKGR